MKRFARISALAGSLALVASAALANDPVYGVWQTKKDDNGNYGYIDVSACGDKICGILIKSFDTDGKVLESDNTGKKIIWDMENLGDGKYGNGKVWSPDRDKTYKSKMELSGNGLAIKGCILGICRDGGTWTRVK